MTKAYDFSETEIFKKSVSELKLWIITDDTLAARMDELMVTLAKVLQQGRLTKSLGIAVFNQLALDGAKKYASHYGGSYHEYFPEAARDAVALGMYNYFVTAVNEGDKSFPAEAATLVKGLKVGPGGWLDNELVAQLEMRAASELEEGGHVNIDSGFIDIVLSDGLAFFIEGQDARDIINNIPDNIRPEDYLLALAQEWV